MSAAPTESPPSAGRSSQATSNAALGAFTLGTSGAGCVVPEFSAGVRRANGWQQFVFLAFDDEARCSQGPAATDMPVIHGVHDHWHGHSGGADEFEKQETVSARHADINQRDVDAMAAKLLKSLSSIGGFRHDGNLRAIKCQTQSIADEFMVVSNQ